MNIVVMAGDDIGPEIIAAAMAVVKAADAEFSLGLRFTDIEVGMASHRKHGITLTDAALQAATDADGVIVGPCGMTDYPPLAEGGVNIPGTIRKRLDLYANLRPARSRAGMPDARRGLDALIVRENTEGFYADRNIESGGSEMLITSDVVVSLRRITRQCCERIARAAFELAMTRRKHVTVVHKANVLRLGDGMFIDSCRLIGKEFPEVQIEEIIVDAMMAHVVRTPERYDVIVTTNMFGDILSDLTAELSGSLGMAASINAGVNYAMAQAAHGSAPDIAGKNIANPFSQVWSAAMLLNWFGQRNGRPAFTQAAQVLETAVVGAVAAGESTKDVGGKLGTKETGQALMVRLAKM